MEQIKGIYEMFRDRADFLTVYIREAHASDEWPVGNICVIPQHKTLQDRLTAAQNFVRDYNYNIPCVVDCMENKFNEVYAIWPERYYVISADNKIAHVSSPTNEFGYEHSKLQHALEKLFRNDDIVVSEPHTVAL